MSAFVDFKKKAGLFGFKVEEHGFYTRDNYKLIIVKVFAKPTKSP